MGCPAAASAFDARVDLGLRRCLVAQVDEHPVIAVDVRLAERLLGDREDPAALLAGGLGHQLLDPQSQVGQGREIDERELVPPAPRELAERGAEPAGRIDAGLVALARVDCLARLLPGGGGALQQRRCIDPGSTAGTSPNSDRAR